MRRHRSKQQGEPLLGTAGCTALQTRALPTLLIPNLYLKKRVACCWAATWCRFTQQQEVRTEAVTAEYAALQQQLAQLHLTAADLGSSARMSDVQQQMAQMESTLAAADREHAARVAGILRKLKVSRHLLHRLGSVGFSFLVMAPSGAHRTVLA